MRNLRHTRNNNTIRGDRQLANRADLAYLFDGVNDYIAQLPSSIGGPVVRGSDGNGDYMQCYNSGFDCGTVTGLDSRSVQTVKVRFTVDEYLGTSILFGRWGGSYTVTTLSIKADGKLQVEIQGTGSMRISGSTVLVRGQEYNVIMRINNSLPSGSARVITDADIFINGVKETLSSSVTGNNTVTSSQVYWGAYSSTLGHYGKLRSLDIWNVALTDGECVNETLSTTVVNSTGLFKSYRPSDASASFAIEQYNLNKTGIGDIQTDADGEHIYMRGTRDGTALIGTSAGFGNSTTPAWTQANSFTIKCRFKVLSTPSGNTGIYGSGFYATIDVTNTLNVRCGIRSGASSTAINAVSPAVLGTMYDVYMVYDASQQKFFVYRGTSGGASVLVNVGGTAIPGNFATDAWAMSDGCVLNSNNWSCDKKYYHACTWARALTQAEIDADIALGNAIKTDPSIVMYYRPSNLKYNRQYIQNPYDLANASWSKGSNTTVTSNYATAPDGTVTADRVQFTGVGGDSLNRVEETSTEMTGSTLASKVFVVKARVRAAAGTQTFRLKCTHWTVANYFSSNQTANTTWQEFTFTQTFTSSTAGAGVIAGVVVDSLNTAADLEVWGVRLFMINETLRDDATNIGGRLGRRNDRVIHLKAKPTADGTGLATVGALLHTPWIWTSIFGSTNEIRIRYDSRGIPRTVGYTLGAGYRGKVTATMAYYRDDGQQKRGLKIYINGAIIANTLFTQNNPSSGTSHYNIIAGRAGSGYFSGYIEDIRVYQGTIDDNDAVKLFWGDEPTSAVKKMHRKPGYTESGEKVVDRSNNYISGQLLNGASRAITAR